MSLMKYAEFEVIEARAAVNANSPRLRTAHRAVFDYTPRQGYIYVRSRAISSRCNDNFDQFDASEIKKGYQTFVGKPVFVNHHNADHRRARGVIIDAALHEDTNPDGTPDTWAEVLMEVDAVRFPVLAREVLKGNIARTSMGVDVKHSICTACGNKAETPLQYCAHIPAMKGMTFRKHLASGETRDIVIAEICVGLGFFENSLLVEQPADPSAFVLGADDYSGMSVAAAVEREADHVVAEAEAITRSAAPVTAKQASTRRQGWFAEADLMISQAAMCPQCNPGMDPSLGALCHSHAFIAPHYDGLYAKGPDVSGAYPMLMTSDQVQDTWVPRGQSTFAASALATRLAYGETRAPKAIDTMRDEKCPVCGDEQGFSSEKCQVCGYQQPPSQFDDPDLDKAKQVDLRQQQQEENGQSPDGQPSDPQDPNGQPLDGSDPQTSDPGAMGENLKCTNCGKEYSVGSEGNPATGADPQEQAAQTDHDDPLQPENSDNAEDDDTDFDDSMADTSQDEDEDGDESEEEDWVDQDSASDPDATGEGRVTPNDPQGSGQSGTKPGDQGNEKNAQDPQAPDPEISGMPVAQNMTCPTCQKGTLLLITSAPEKEPEVNDKSDSGAPGDLGSHTSSTQGRGSRRKMSRDMNQPNPAQRDRSALLRAVQAQQKTIESLMGAVATLAVAAKIDKNPAFASIVSEARTAGLIHQADSAQNPDGSPSTTTEEAKKPQATDDPTSEGAAPSEVNKDVTPKAVTDVSTTDVSATPPMLDNLTDVTAPTAGTDTVDPGADDSKGSKSDMINKAPSDDVMDPPGSTGWSNTSAKDDQARFVASLRLARLQIQAGLESEEDLSLAQRIAASESTNGEISAQVNVLQSLSQKSSNQGAPRRLVPQSSGRNNSAPSLSSVASSPNTSSSAQRNEDEWMVGYESDFNK